MTRRCSHCSHNGHNSRTCPNRGVKLFGVRLTDGLIRKSASMGNLAHYTGSGSNNGTPLNGIAGGSHDSPGDTPEHGGAADGYASEDFVAGSSSSRERKKGVPWTEEEHRMFLLGLQKLGKGDWRGISRNFVISRTPTQVASHAQKYFIRQCNVSKRKRRSSLFDIVAGGEGGGGGGGDGAAPMVSHDFFAENPPKLETRSIFALPSPPALEEEIESMDSTTNINEEEPGPIPQIPEVHLPCYYPVVYPTYIPSYFPVPIWPPPPPAYNQEQQPAIIETHQVVRPTAVHSKSPINVDELTGLSKLTIAESDGNRDPSLSLKLLDGSTRQSAFHANPASRNSNTGSSSNNAIHAL